MECDICADIALKKRSSRKLSDIILDCWQREYDKRPYAHVIFHGNVFKHKFFRKMTDDDFLMILQFLELRAIKHFEFLYCAVPVAHTQIFLKCLDDLVSVNFTHSDVPWEMFQYLAENAKRLSLKTLKLCGNEIDEKRSECLRVYLSQTEKLVHLDVSNCGLNHITLATIADGILNCKNLRSIDLSNFVPHHPQLVDVSKISVILSILIWSSRLMEVHYCKIGLGCSGLGIICENISVGFLRILDIGANCIGPDGTEALFLALRNSNVAALLMPFNKIGDVGGDVIAKHLSTTKLEHLDISYNKISSQTMESILTNLTRCNRMATLNIYGNDFDSPTVGSVLHILITNQILNADGLDVSVNYVDGIHQIFPIDNPTFNNYQKFQKLTQYCAKENINPQTLLWFKKNLRHVVGHDT
ncbi:hypothetical protein HA402_004886 [Bradysia odoriphaga]|nr:hypothetical protein HA402_004886 [Bradysia odoriphaga]